VEDSPIAQRITILLVDDDEEDLNLTADALSAGCGGVADLHFASDGEDLLHYLWGQGRHSCPDAAPRPDLILLDLNLPRKDGREALAEIKSDPSLRAIPIVVFSTSGAQSDIRRSYELGVCSFVRKPATFAQLQATMNAIACYWCRTVELPRPGGYV
jgi:two-component system, response regulator